MPPVPYDFSRERPKGTHHKMPPWFAAICLHYLLQALHLSVWTQASHDLTPRQAVHVSCVWHKVHSQIWHKETPQVPAWLGTVCYVWWCVQAWEWVQLTCPILQWECHAGQLQERFFSSLSWICYFRKCVIVSHKEMLNDNALGSCTSYKLSYSYILKTILMHSFFWIYITICPYIYPENCNAMNDKGISNDEINIICKSGIDDLYSIDKTKHCGKLHVLRYFSCIMCTRRCMYTTEEILPCFYSQLPYKLCWYGNSCCIYLLYVGKQII